MPMKNRGRVQVALRRAFRVNPGPITTRQLMEWAYPRGRWRSRLERHSHARVIRKAADQLAARVGRRWPDGVIWRVRDN